MHGIEEYQGPLAALGAWWSPWTWFRPAPTPVLPTASAPQPVTVAPAVPKGVPVVALAPPPPPAPAPLPVVRAITPTAPTTAGAAGWPADWDRDVIAGVSAAVAMDPANRDAIVKWVGTGMWSRKEQVSSYVRAYGAEAGARKQLVPNGHAAPWVLENRNSVQQDYFNTRIVKPESVYAVGGGSYVALYGEGTADAGFFGPANAPWSYIDPVAAGLAGKDIPVRGSPPGESWFVNLTAKGQGRWRVVRSTGETYTAPLGTWDTKPPPSIQPLHGLGVFETMTPATWLLLASVGYFLWRSHRT